MTIYVVNQDGCFRASFLKLEEAEKYLIQRSLKHPNSTWTIDEYEQPSTSKE